ncbi:MAG: aldo/keto reductase [Candidatus Limnocylindrales bacterium]|jgi:hypothetical protein
MSAIGLGCMGMSQSYDLAPKNKDTIPVLRAGVDRGVAFFDTAQIYGPFLNEELVGEVLAPVRDQVAMATNSAGALRQNLLAAGQEFSRGAAHPHPYSVGTVPTGPSRSRLARPIRTMLPSCGPLPAATTRGATRRATP